MHNSNPNFPAAESSIEPVDSTFDALSKEKHQRRFQRGIKWMGIGALTLVLSFVVNFLCFQCAVDFHTPMYILTSIGAISILKGMADVFGL